MVFYEVLQVLLLKYCKLIHYIQYNFSGEKNIHRVTSKTLKRFRQKQLYDLAILRTTVLGGFFAFAKIYISQKILCWFLRLTGVWLFCNF